jgi:hypothetical protein
LPLPSRPLAQACQGNSTATVVIQSVRPVAGADGAPCIALRNIGAKTANLTGTRLLTPFAPDALTIASRRECAANATLEPGKVVTFTPRTDASPCGFPFPLNATCVRRPGHGGGGAGDGALE